MIHVNIYIYSKCQHIWPLVDMYETYLGARTLFWENIIEPPCWKCGSAALWGCDIYIYIYTYIYIYIYVSSSSNIVLDVYTCYHLLLSFVVTNCIYLYHYIAAHSLDESFTLSLSFSLSLSPWPLLRDLHFYCLLKFAIRR